MNRIDRLFGILVLLQSKKYLMAEDIAEKFGISVRTVYRDLKALSEQGIPICFEAHQGYSVVQGYFLPPVSFSTDEANALVLMESVVYAFSDKSVQKHYGSALDKVKTVLRSGQKEKLELLNDNIRMHVPASLNHDFEFLSTIQNAISSRHILFMEYTNTKAETTRRQIEPIGLVFYAFSWHLIAWCHFRKDYRDFKVARVVHLRDTETPFTKPDHIDLNTYIKCLPENY